MIVEVFKDGRTIGFVVAKNNLEAYKLIHSAFPNVDRVNTTYSLPKHDERCKKIAENIYSWA